MNTYQGNYNTIDGLIAFEKTFLVKLGELNNQLKSLNPPNSMIAHHTHFVDLVNIMYSYIEQMISYSEDNNISAANQQLTNFNNAWHQFVDYYNTLT